MNTDSYYEIGAGHTFCQDYADSGRFVRDNNVYHWVAVADGCSGSKDSDFGARFLVKLFPTVINLSLDAKPEEFRQTVEELFVLKIRQGMNLSLPKTAFDATLVACLHDMANDTLHTFIWGDGKAYYRYRHGPLPIVGVLTDVSYVKNAPYYLSYLTEIDKELRYESFFGTLYADIVPSFVRTDGLMTLVGESKSRQKFHYEARKDASVLFSQVSVFSDGIDTYHKKDDVNTLMPRHNVFEQMTQYKNTHGEFVKRRMQKVKSFCLKEGWQHFDDIAVSTMVF